MRFHQRCQDDSVPVYDQCEKTLVHRTQHSQDPNEFAYEPEDCPAPGTTCRMLAVDTQTVFRRSVNKLDFVPRFDLREFWSEF